MSSLLGIITIAPRYSLNFYCFLNCYYEIKHVLLWKVSSCTYFNFYLFRVSLECMIRKWKKNQKYSFFHLCCSATDVMKCNLCLRFFFRHNEYINLKQFLVGLNLFLKIIYQPPFTIYDKSINQKIIKYY